MICAKCNNQGVHNTAGGKEFYYCRTCKDEIIGKPDFMEEFNKMLEDLKGTPTWAPPTISANPTAHSHRIVNVGDTVLWKINSNIYVVTSIDPMTDIAIMEDSAGIQWTVRYNDLCDCALYDLISTATYQYYVSYGGNWVGGASGSGQVTVTGTTI